MGFETLLVERVGDVAEVTLNRPESMNAMDPQMAKDLSQLAIDCDTDPGVRAVLLTGAGRMFCAGGDLKGFAEQANIRAALLGMAGDLHLGISRLTRMNAPVIAAINGTAAGAGFSLAMAADLAIAADNAVFTMAYTRAGLSPDGSSTFFMPRRIGDRRARELMLTNRVLSAQEALDWGIVNRVVPGDQLMESARELAAELAAGPTAAFGSVKTLLNASFDNGLEAQMELESRAIAAMGASADGQEGIHAFVEKRKPNFTGGADA
ncbi:MAG: enoyl-CoA hydratase-related protein [Pseudomonadota bacterium]